MYLWDGFVGFKYEGKMGLFPKEGVFFETKKITCEEASGTLSKSCLSFGGHLESSNEEKMRRQQKGEVLQ